MKQNVKKSKRNYFERAFNNQNCQHIWKSINYALYNKCEHKTNEIKQLTINNDKITKPEEICEHFNNFFVNIGQDLANKIPKSDKQYPEKLYIKTP